MSTAATVSVVICAYSLDRWEDLVAATESVRRQTTQAVETIVVIDHNPALLERARDEFDLELVVGNEEKPGLSGARNSGTAVAKGEVIAFLDDDAEAAPDWLARLMAAYEDEQVLGTGGSIEPVWPSGRPAWFPEEFDWVVGCTYRGMSPRTKSVRNLIGCNMSFRRGVFECVGGFRHEIGRIGTRPVAGEETELCIRAKQHWPDGRFVYEPTARVRHRVSANRTRWSYFRSRCFAEGLSKALVAQFVGAGDGLSTERDYTLRTLPFGVLRGLRDSMLRADPGGVARSGSILLGFSTTVAGYITGVASLKLNNKETLAGAQLVKHTT